MFEQDGRVKSKNPMSRTSSGRPGRPRHEIEAILRQHRDSGLSLLAFARQHHLPYPTLWGWRRRLAAIHAPNPQAAPRIRRPSSPAPAQAFIPVEVESVPAPADFLLAWAPDRSLRIPPGFDPGELRRLLDVLGVRP